MRSAIPDAVAATEAEICEWLTSQGLLRPCPFETRLSKSDRTKELKRIVQRLGRRYEMATLQNFEVYDERQAEAVNRLSAFAAEMPTHLMGGGGLLLFGDPGTGKDHLLAACLKLAVALHSLSVEWYDGGELFDALAEAARDERPDELRKLQKSLHAPHILALSDPQPPKGDLSGPQIRRVRDIIDRRYRDGKSTWLTTNLDRTEDAAALLTTPVLQRLKEGTGQVLCSWPAYRDRRKAVW